MKLRRTADALKEKFIKGEYCTLKEFAERVKKSPAYIENLSAKYNWISDRDAYMHTKKNSTTNIKDRKILLDKINGKALDRLMAILDQDDVSPDFLEKAIAIGLQYTQQKPASVYKNEIESKNENASTLYRNTIQRIKAGLEIQNKLIPEENSSEDNVAQLN